MNKTERMKLVRILGMLGSEHDGERASAAMAAHRVIQAAGTSWAQLLADVPGLCVSVSHTTRAMRPGEVDGVNYHFVAPDVFQTMAARGEFLEHAVVFGNRYGTARAGVAAQLAQGQDVVLEIDWQGARRIRELFPDALSIFILPPSIEALRERLEHRAQDEAAVIERRMEAAAQEISHQGEYDYRIMNGQFDAALAELTAIINARRAG